MDAGRRKRARQAVADRSPEHLDDPGQRLPHRADRESLKDGRRQRTSALARHEHLGAGEIGPAGLGAILRDPRLAGTVFMMETPGVEAGYDAVNMRRARMLYGGASELPILPPKAFRLTRRATRIPPSD